MRILVDTHCLIWAFLDTKQLPMRMFDALMDEKNEVHYSQASLWEISIKYNLGKIVFKDLEPEELYNEIEASFFTCRTITNHDLVSFHRLPIVHRDPFDRLMIWQCIQSDLHFASTDAQAAKYEAFGLKTLR